MLLRLFSHIILFSLLTTHAVSQDTLPGLKVVNRSGKVIVSWVNPFRDVVLINIQRSPDSLKNFKTVLGVADPSAITNGYRDTKAPDMNQFYRLYVQQEAGKYFFTRSYRPVVDNMKPRPKSPSPVAGKPNEGEAPLKADTAKSVVTAVPSRPSAKATVPVTGPMRDEKKVSGPDSLTSQKKKTSNTLTPKSDTVRKAPPPPPPPPPPPVNIYTNSQGQVVIIVPEDKKNIYTLKFFTDSGTSLFTLNKIKESRLTLEKTNFHNSGWFRCELYETDKLKHTYKVFIPKD